MRHSGCLLRSDAQWRSRRTTIAARGMRFDALTAGPADGELVLLLHGFPQTGTCWHDALTSLSTSGVSSGRPEPARVLARALVRRASRLTGSVSSARTSSPSRPRSGETASTSPGTTGAARVAWALAGDHPEAVASLTAVSTPHTAALRQALQRPQQRLRMAYIPVLRLPFIPESLIDAGGGIVAESLLTATGLSPAHAHRDIDRAARGRARPAL